MTRAHTGAHTASPLTFAGARVDEAAAKREWGRKAILAGWVVTMVGVVGYCFAMMRAGHQAGVLDALTTQGLLGWGSAALLVGGVALWLAGNLAFLRETMELPPPETEDEA